MKTPSFWCKVSLLILALFWFLLYFAGKSPSEVETTSKQILRILGLITFALFEFSAGVILPLTLLESGYSKKSDLMEVPLKDWITGLPLLLLQLPGPLAGRNVRVPRMISYPIAILAGLLASVVVSLIGTLLFLTLIGRL